MTEAEWLRAEATRALIDFLGPDQKRRLRLFALSCCRRNSRFITDARSIAAVDFADRYAESGVRGRKGRASIAKAAEAVYTELDAERDRSTEGTVRFAEILVRIGGSLASAALLHADEHTTAKDVPEFLASSAAFEWALRNCGNQPAWKPEAMQPEMCQEVAILREIFGNPFRPVAFSPDWRTDTALALARQMYDSRDFSAMPILADALQDAGCDSDNILDHCRGPGPHVRGCWVVDLVLGKE
jgi:hypothetical protein